MHIRQIAKRIAFFALGAGASATVSAVVSYSAVSLMYPRAETQAGLARFDARQAPESVVPALPEQVTLLSAPADMAIRVEPISALPGLEIGLTETGAALEGATPEPFVYVNRDEPTALPGAPDATPVERDALLTPPAPVAQPETAQSTTLTALPAETQPTATTPFVDPTPPVEATPAIAAAETSGIPALHPAPRPEVPVLAALPGLRPQPRPEAPVVRVAAAAPATTTQDVTPVQRASGSLFSGGGTCNRSLARAIPRRRSGEETGSAFFANLSGVGGSERDNRIIKELARGNVPGFLRRLEPVTFRGTDSRGSDAEITICVTPDYLALGSDSDYVRVPLGLPAAARIAGAFDMLLPTPRMVDAIYAQADVRLSPSPMTPGSQMSSTSYFLRHNATIQKQLRGRRGLVGGHKKDVVMASRMASNPGRVAIYGWHRPSGRPIQPVSTVHGKHYADYSHGIRLVSQTAYLNGRAVDLSELLSSSRYAYLLNKEGPLPGPVMRTASR